MHLVLLDIAHFGPTAQEMDRAFAEKEAKKAEKKALKAEKKMEKKMKKMEKKMKKMEKKIEKTQKKAEKKMEKGFKNFSSIGTTTTIDASSNPTAEASYAAMPVGAVLAICASLLICIGSAWLYRHSNLPNRK